MEKLNLKKIFHNKFIKLRTAYSGPQSNQLDTALDSYSRMPLVNKPKLF